MEAANLSFQLEPQVRCVVKYEGKEYWRLYKIVRNIVRDIAYKVRSNKDFYYMFSY